MLIDDVTIKIKAGDGGKGAVAFQKNKMSLGPTGTRGGHGGSIYVEGVSNLSALNQFVHKKDITAKNGEDGRGQFRDGARGEDLILKVPVGTVIFKENILITEITKIGEKILIAKGGRGGKGNFFFRSPINTSPQEFQVGTPGEKFTIRFELKLIADVGFIGLPNAGKSSLLNALTSAKAKVADYPFTTLEPNLGAYYELIIADIPGLIEGASYGKGLGIKFLKHIERTRALMHLISSESKDPTKDYKVIRDELGAYNKELLEKPEYVILSKTDLGDSSTHSGYIKKLKKLNPQIVAVSIQSKKGLEDLKKILNKIKDEKIMI